MTAKMARAKSGGQNPGAKPGGKTYQLVPTEEEILLQETNPRTISNSFLPVTIDAIFLTIKLLVACNKNILIYRPVHVAL